MKEEASREAFQSEEEEEEYLHSDRQTLQQSLISGSAQPHSFYNIFSQVHTQFSSTVKYCKTQLGNISLSIYFSWKDVRQSKQHFFMTVATLFLLVFLSGFFILLYSQLSIVFQKLVESQQGEYDLTILPSGQLLNFHSLYDSWKNNPTVNYGQISPRWMMQGKILHSNVGGLNYSVTILLLDSQREIDMKLSREWNYPPLEVFEAQIRDGVLERIGATEGDTVTISIPAGKLFPSEGSTQMNSSQLLKQIIIQESGIDFQQQIPMSNLTQLIKTALNISDDSIVIKLIESEFPNNSTTTLDDVYNVFVVPLLQDDSSDDSIAMKFKVKNSFSSNFGKYPSNFGNTVILDYKYFPQSLKQSFLQKLRLKEILERLGLVDRFFSFFDKLDFAKHTPVIVGFSKERYSMYRLSNAQTKQKMLEISNDLIESVGLHTKYQLQFPIYLGLQQYFYINVFFSQLVFAIVVLVTSMAILFTLSLFLSDTEEKVFTHALLRTMGLQARYLILMIVSKSMYFAIPACIIGITVAYFTGLFSEIVLLTYVNLPWSALQWKISSEAIAIPLVLAFAVPLVAAIFPIKAALSKVLRESLDKSHSDVFAIKIQSQFLLKHRIDTTQTILSLFVVIGGFCMYYFLPMTFIMKQPELFFFILISILLVTLFALCLIAVQLESVFEKLFLHVSLFILFKDVRFKPVIFKNMFANKIRNKRTFMIYCLAMSFVVFAGTLFSLQMNNLSYAIRIETGSDISIQSKTGNYFLPETQLLPLLEEFKASNWIIDYATISHRWADWCEEFYVVQFTKLSYLLNTVNLFTSSRNLLQVVFSDTLNIGSLDSQLSYSMSEDGYTPDIVDSLIKDAGRATVEMDYINQNKLNGELYVPFKSILPVEGRKRRVTLNESLSYDYRLPYLNYTDIIMSEAMYLDYGYIVGVGKPCSFNAIGLHFDTPSWRWKIGYDSNFCKVRATVKKFPGFGQKFSARKDWSFRSPVLISESKLLEISSRVMHKMQLSIPNEWYANLYPKQKLFLKLPEEVKQDSVKRLKIIHALENIVDVELADIYDTTAVLSSLDLGIQFMQIFFIFLSAISIIISFFALFVNVHANLRDNSYTIAVLRSVGMSTQQILRIYIYEALALLFSAGLCGTTVGTLLAILLTLQYNTWLETPFRLDFPFSLLLTVLVASIVIAVTATVLASKKWMRVSISSTLKHQS